MTTSTVRLSVPKPGMSLIELDRPDRHNAVDLSMVSALTAAFAAADTPIVVLASSRGGTFCSGADLTVGNDERVAVSDQLHALYEAMLEMPAAIVAAVGGPALGGGAQLAVASDVRIVSPDAYFRFLGAGHGLAVGGWALSGLVGRGRAFELCTTMRAVGAEEAVSIGLATSMATEPTSAAVAFADTVLAADRDAVARLKSVLGIADRLDALRAERIGNREAWDGRPPAR